MTDILINTQTYRHTQKHNTKRLRYVTTLQAHTSHKYRHTYNKHCYTGNMSPLDLLISIFPVLSCHHELFTGTMKHFLLIEFCDRIQCCWLGGVWGMGMGYGVWDMVVWEEQSRLFELEYYPQMCIGDGFIFNQIWSVYPTIQYGVRTCMDVRSRI